MIIDGKDLKNGYRRFIIDSWLKSYRYSPENKYLRTSVYKSVFFKLIQNELNASVVEIIDDDNNKICSYVVYEKKTFEHESQLHTGERYLIKFMYTTKTHRNQGYAKKFLRKLQHNDWVYCNFITANFVAVCNKLKIDHMYLPTQRRYENGKE